jgi:hypothetical protein
MEMQNEGVTAPKIPDAAVMQAGSAAPEAPQAQAREDLKALIERAFWSNSQDEIKKAMLLVADRIEALETAQ